MRKTIISIVSGIILIGTGFFVSNNMAGREKPQRKQPEKVAQSVITQEVLNQTIPTTVYESGILTAKNRIELFAEVQGIMEPTRKEFKPGNSYQLGELLIKIRDTDYSANLQAQKSSLQNLIASALPDLRLDFPEAYVKWDHCVRDFEMNKPGCALLGPGPISSLAFTSFIKYFDRLEFHFLVKYIGENNKMKLRFRQLRQGHSQHPHSFSI